MPLKERAAAMPGPLAALWNGEVAATVVRLGLVLAVGGGALTAVLLNLHPDADTPAPANVRAPLMLPSFSVDEAPSVPSAPRARVDGFATKMRDLSSAEDAGFVRTARLEPKRLCDIFKADGWTTEKWARSALGEGGGECTAERSYAEADGARKTLSFAIIRGSEADEVREIRIKLNIHDKTSRAEAARDAAAVLTELFAQLNWSGVEVPAAKIAALEPFALALFGTTIRFWREYGEVDRYNLVLNLPASTRLPVDRLAPVTSAQGRVVEVGPTR